MPAQYPPLVERWRPYIRRLAPEIPEGFALVWIARESGGRPSSRSKLDERGLAQVHPGEATAIGLTPEEWGGLALGEGAPGYSAELHARAAVALMRRCVVYAGAKMRAAGVTWPSSSPDAWAMTKLVHTLPAMLRGLGDYVRANHAPPPSWGAWAEWMQEHWAWPGYSPARIKQLLANAAAPARAVGELGGAPHVPVALVALVALAVKVMLWV
jgi:hypothetical protein